MFRPICLLTLAMAGCAQYVAPVAPTGLQSTVPNARAGAAKPAESVYAHVAFRNETNEFSLLTVYWSYAANPFWHEEVRKCVLPGHGADTRVVYNHIKQGPQIKFRADSTFWPCVNQPLSARTVAFHAINFTPDAHFQVEYRSKPNDDFALCARGGGNKEVCHSR